MAPEDPMLTELIAFRQQISALTTGLAVNTEVVTALKRTFDDLRANSVPRGEWIESRRGDQQRFTAIEDDVETLKDDKKADLGFRRTLFAMFAVAAFSGAFSAAIALATFVLGK